MKPYIDTQKIEEYIRKNNLSTTAFCKKCGITQCSYKKIMSGSCKMQISTFMRIIYEIKVLPTDVLKF